MLLLFLWRGYESRNIVEDTNITTDTIPRIEDDIYLNKKFKVE